MDLLPFPGGRRETPPCRESLGPSAGHWSPTSHPCSSSTPAPLSLGWVSQRLRYGRTWDRWTAGTASLRSPAALKLHAVTRLSLQNTLVLARHHMSTRISSRLFFWNLNYKEEKRYVIPETQKRHPTEKKTSLNSKMTVSVMTCNLCSFICLIIPSLVLDLKKNEMRIIPLICIKLFS